MSILCLSSLARQLLVQPCLLQTALAYIQLQGCTALVVPLQLRIHFLHVSFKVSLCLLITYNYLLYMFLHYTHVTFDFVSHTGWGVEPDVTHQTFWLASTGTRKTPQPVQARASSAAQCETQPSTAVKAWLDTK